MILFSQQQHNKINGNKRESYFLVFLHFDDLIGPLYKNKYYVDQSQTKQRKFGQLKKRKQHEKKTLPTMTNLILQK
jgi:hypothetical protein